MLHFSAAPSEISQNKMFETVAKNTTDYVVFYMDTNVFLQDKLKELIDKRWQRVKPIIGKYLS